MTELASESTTHGAATDFGVSMARDPGANRETMIDICVTGEVGAQDSEERTHSRLASAGEEGATIMMTIREIGTGGDIAPAEAAAGTAEVVGVVAIAAAGVGAERGGAAETERRIRRRKRCGGTRVVRDFFTFSFSV